MKAKSLCVIAAIGVAAALCISLVYRTLYPYGTRSCFLPCTLQALREYAAANGGWFPFAAPPAFSLELLYPVFLPNSDYLAGISGDRSSVERSLRERSYITTNESSWVYIQGLRTGDPEGLAVVWEATSGVGPNGIRTHGRAVGFVDGTIRQVPDDAWGQFLQTQAVLRASVLKLRQAPKPAKGLSHDTRSPGQ